MPRRISLLRSRGNRAHNLMGFLGIVDRFTKPKDHARRF